jgi:hypothetical protein
MASKGKNSKSPKKDLDDKEKPKTTTTTSPPPGQQAREVKGNASSPAKATQSVPHTPGASWATIASHASHAPLLHLLLLDN